MHTQLNGLVNCSRYLSGVACAIALLLVSVQPAFSATRPDGTLMLTDGKEQFMSTLASMPYISSGAGPVLYVVECSAFPQTQAFERDWKGQLDGVEVRRIFVAVSPTTANEVGYLARTRNLDDFYAFLNRTKVAPTITSQDKAGVTAAQSMIHPYGKVLKPLMIKNGWKKDSPVPPQFMWEASGHVYVSGYSKGSFQHILTMLRSDTQTKEASAPPSLLPSDQPVSTNNESSVTETTGQLRTAENKNPRPEGNAAVTQSGKASVVSGGTGPDVLGLRIGMSPEETRAVFKSRGWASDGYREVFGELQFSLSGGYPQAIPNSKYLALIDGLPIDPSNELRLNVEFGPTPAQEGIVLVNRYQGFPPSSKPTLDTFEKALVEKYGTPTDEGRNNKPLTYRWRYDRSGKLIKSTSSMQGLVCPEAYTTLPLKGLFAPMAKIEALLEYKQNVTYCGAIVVELILGTDTGLPGRNDLIRSYTTSMLGFDLALQAFSASKRIVDNAAGVASEAAIKKGQQQKPEL